MTLRLVDPGYLHGPTRLRRIALVALAGAGSFAGTLVLSSDLLLHSSTAAIISDSPKEVMDEAWQIVFRDYLDTTGNYSEEKWKTLRRDLLSKSYGNTKDAYEAIRGMLGTLDDPTRGSWIRVSSRRWRSTPQGNSLGWAFN